MEKLDGFGSVLMGYSPKKLSISSSKRKIPALCLPLKGVTANRALERFTNPVRCDELDLSKSAASFDRGLRKSSSLTNGIDSVHCSDMDTNRIQESMAKKARGLTVHSASITIPMSILPIPGPSGEQPTNG